MAITDVKPDRTRSGHIRAILFWFLLFLAVTLGLFSFYSSNHFDLLKSASVIVAKPDLISKIYSYRWIDAENISLSGPYDDKSSVDQILNYKTGKVSTLPALQAGYEKEVERLHSSSASGAIFSPDGRKVRKLVGSFGNGTTIYSDIFDVTGKVLKSDSYLMTRAVRPSHWLPDSKGVVSWMEPWNGTSILTFKTTYLDGRPTIVRNYETDTSHFIRGIAVDPQFRIICSESSRIKDSKFRLIRVPLLSNAPVSRVTIERPDRGMQLTTIPSPDGTKLLIAYCNQNELLKEGVPGFIDRILHKKHVAYASVWICNFDGSNMKQLGHAEFPKEKDYSRVFNIAVSCRWMPDGKHISFVDNYMLYSIPCE